nr:hypothetical protein B0A51_03361 [Rachicladosporium sp. CCFEE 5018]
MKTDPEYVDGIYEIAPRTYHESTSEITHFDFPAQRHFTPREVDSMLRTEGFDRYNFTDGGIGCRYWNIIILHRLELLGFIAQESALHLHSDLPYMYSTLRERVSWPIKQGTWDDPGTSQRALRMWDILSEKLTEKIDREERIARLFELARHPTNRAKVAQYLQALDVDPVGLADQMPQRRRLHAQWVSQRSALEVSAEQGEELARKRASTSDDEEDEDEEQELNEERGDE